MVRKETGAAGTDFQQQKTFNSVNNVDSLNSKKD